MAEMEVFRVDGVPYNVRVMELTRNFSIVEKGKVGRTQDGQMYRDIFGTFYNYTMKISEKNGDAAALDAFWEAISGPQISHVCVFPYGQNTLTQRMYITGGEQALQRISPSGNRWGELTVHFVAVGPEVTPCV